MDQNEADKMICRVKGHLNDQKSNVHMYYATLKLKLPTHVKALTLYKLEQAGVIITPNFTLPREAKNFVQHNADSTRKRANLFEKMNDIYNRKKNLMLSYFSDAKRQLPQELLNKKIGDLDDTEQTGLVWFKC